MLALGWMGLLAVAVTLVGWRWWKTRDPDPIFGVYRQRGRWFYLKYLVFQFVLRVRQLKAKYRSHDEDEGTARKTIETMDQAQPLSTDPDAFDAVFFIATNKAGYYFIMGSERRQHNIINGLCYLLVPGKGLLCSHKIPDTVLFGARDGDFGAEGILMRPITAMHKWRVQFKGKMFLLTDPSKEFEVLLEADWTSSHPAFNYDTDLHPNALARSIAREEWTREYFNNLKEAHQTHYEQMGTMKGEVQIYTAEGVGLPPEIHTLEMQAFRDHSYGMKRDWDLMHRYAFHMFFLEDGTSASIGVICQPCTCSTLETGFVTTPDGQVHPVEWCDLELYQHGESGTPPTDHSFQFKAGPTIYTVQVSVQQQSVHYVGWRWEARMVERFVRYVVNGVPGRGVSEFHYHNTSGRREDVAKDDPQWFTHFKRK